jgi:murein DD-endopeptidase MepM/ murein hydrolase activator NlpD
MSRSTRVRVLIAACVAALLLALPAMSTAFSVSSEAPEPISDAAWVKTLPCPSTFHRPFANYIVTSRNGVNGHVGVDVDRADGINIHSAARGLVKIVGWDPGGYGRYVVVKHGCGVRTLYAHMINGSVVVNVGQRLARGQVIGQLGCTGNCHGSHLHMEARGDNSTNWDHLGAPNIDPLPRFRAD